MLYIKAKIKAIRSYKKVQLEGTDDFLLKSKNYKDILGSVKSENIQSELHDYNVFINDISKDICLIEIDFVFKINYKLWDIIANVFNSSCAYIFSINENNHLIIAVRKCD